MVLPPSLNDRVNNWSRNLARFWFPAPWGIGLSMVCWVGRGGVVGYIRVPLWSKPWIKTWSLDQAEQLGDKSALTEKQTWYQLYVVNLKIWITICFETYLHPAFTNKDSIRELFKTLLQVWRNFVEICRGKPRIGKRRIRFHHLNI